MITSAVTRQGARFTGALFSLVLLGGCAAGPDILALSLEREPSALIADVPFHGQREYQCGPAALAMALNHSGSPATVDELIPQVYLPAREGSLQPEMLASARRHDRISYTLDGRMSSLLSEVEAGHPVIVLQNLSLPFYPMWHYAVVIGYDLDQARLILHTGETPSRTTGIRRFDNTWKRSERWAMVVMPPDQLPASVTADRAAESISNFERVAGVDAAYPAWRVLTERSPEYATGWFALGNAAYGRGELATSVEAFREATRRRDDFGAAWLNLGLALEETGAIDEAIGAIQQAASLPGPWQQYAADVLVRMQAAH